MTLGTHLTLLIGPSIPVPAPPSLMEAIESVQVTHQDRGRSGFQIVFQSGRGGPWDFLDDPRAKDPLLRPFNRVVLMVTLNVRPRVLMDGIITHRQFAPGDEPGSTKLTVTGEDVSVMMDLHRRRAEYPAQDETVIALRIIASYARFGLAPLVIPPRVLDVPIPVEYVRVQQDTDLAFLRQIAECHGYTFFVSPGPAPLSNLAYWGPPRREGVPQRALSVNTGAQTNVDSISFQYNALGPTVVEDVIQDRQTNQRLPVRSFASTRLPLASQPALLANQPNVRTTFRETRGGMRATQAMACAQGVTDRSSDDVVSADGELNTNRYGDLLEPRKLVGLRGVGYTHDGLYYVNRVTHRIDRGSYKQSFSIAREGDGALAPVVRP